MKKNFVNVPAPNPAVEESPMVEEEAPKIEASKNKEVQVNSSDKCNCKNCNCETLEKRVEKLEKITR